VFPKFTTLRSCNYRLRDIILTDDTVVKQNTSLPPSCFSCFLVTGLVARRP